MARQKKEDKGGKERKKNWKEYTATVENIQDFLADRIFLRHNMAYGVMKPPVGGGREGAGSRSPTAS